MKWMVSTLLAYCVFFSVNSSANTNCKNYVGDYQIDFSGGLSGPGKLSIASSNTQIGLYELNTKLLNPNGTDIVAQVDGIGTCENGVFKVRLGADRNSHPTYKVLGGSTIGIMQPEVTAKQIGYWELLMLNKETAERITISGLWIVSKKVQ